MCPHKSPLKGPGESIPGQTNPAENIIIMMGDALSQKNAITRTNVMQNCEGGHPSADAPAGCEEITAIGMEGAARLRDSASWCG